MVQDKFNSELINYIVENHLKPGERLPALSDLSDHLNLSVGKLREQLEVARQLGFVSVRPHHGTLREPFDFYPAVNKSLFFGLATGEATFAQFSSLRQTLEANLWHQAVDGLTNEDKEDLHNILNSAWKKLKGESVHIPEKEHRGLHLTIFKRLNNPFVIALLKAYWDAYEATELTRFADYQYWLTVWRFHEQIVEAICLGDYEGGRKLLIQHFALLPTVTLPT